MLGDDLRSRLAAAAAVVQGCMVTASRVTIRSLAPSTLRYVSAFVGIYYALNIDYRLPANT